MINSSPTSHISNTLINWYEQNKRELPWRDITDPYKIWISEIILQQTRVNQGLSYYLRFIERFPTVSQLAQAEEDEVLKYWQGLGYYSRARNLHKAAKQIASKFNGVFPADHANVLQLSGIGEYTAAAICSFAYNQPYAVVDGNVFRVLSRLFGIATPIDSTSGKKEFSELAKNLLSSNEPASHNQAIMEFGALQCVPTSPDCLNCPLQASCQAFQTNSVSTLPVKAQKTKVTNRFFNYLFIEFQGNTFLQKRTGKDVWQNLYEFPLIETDRLLNSSELIENEYFKTLFAKTAEVDIYKISHPMKHVLSHRVIYAQFITIKVNELNMELEKLTKTAINEIDKFAVSRLMELFLEKLA
ncbi:MAG TPA: A/G-specific adenine glycosylase [Paludibacter sp.]|nr:A/G-specific adenine glycosylase [Paludibacter sp.]